MTHSIWGTSMSSIRLTPLQELSVIRATIGLMDPIVEPSVKDPVEPYCFFCGCGQWDENKHEDDCFWLAMQWPAVPDGAMEYEGEHYLLESYWREAGMPVIPGLKIYWPDRLMGYVASIGATGEDWTVYSAHEDKWYASEGGRSWPFVVYVAKLGSKTSKELGSALFPSLAERLIWRP